MHRGASLAAGLLLSLALGCGSEPQGPAMELQFSKQELLSEAAVVAIYFFDGALSCELVRTPATRPTSILGPYTTPLDDDARARGVTFPLDEVPVGEYVVYVEAYDINGALVGSGCAPGQRVFDGEISRIRVTIS